VLIASLSGAPASAQVVSEVVVEGNEHISRDRILLLFGMVINDDFTTEGVREGIRRLYETGSFSDVQVHAEELEDGTLRFVVAVQERPRISSVDIMGNDGVSDTDIESVLRVERGIPFDSGRLEDSRVAVLALYESKGYPGASVEVSTEDLSGNNVRVVIRINEGTRVVVKRIEFRGGSIQESRLKDVMETKEDRWWRTNAFLEKAVLEDDLFRIEDRYRAEGYIDAKVTGYETVYEEDGKRATVTIVIDEGNLYTVSDVEWVGASGFAEDALYDLTGIRPGDIYSPEDAEKIIRDAYSWYGERGYIHATIYRQEDIESDSRVRLLFNVNEDEPARVGRIHIVGNTRTNEKVIRRQLTIKPGDLYQTSEVVASQHKVANLGFFYGPEVEFTDSADLHDIDLVFKVEERETGRAGVGVSHTSEKGIVGFLELSEGNLFGSGRHLDLRWEFGAKNTELVLGFTEPWFMDKHLSVGFDIYDTSDKHTYGLLDDDFYRSAFSDSIAHSDIWELEDPNESRRYIVERERRGGDIRIGWPFMGSRNTMLYTKYTLEQVKLYEYGQLSIPVYEDTTLVVDHYDTEEFVKFDEGWEWRSGLTTTLSRRTTDRRFHPRRGSYSRFTVDLVGWAFGGDVEYQRYVFETRKYVPTFWNTTLMLRGRTGIVTGYGDPGTVPDDTRFELGGVGLYGVRGYKDRSILPVGRELYGGRTMLIGSVELKYPIMEGGDSIPIYVLGFVDAGNTWENVEDTHPSVLYWGAGVGVRVEVPVFGNMGVDVGYGFDEELGGEWEVHYRFGMEF
jgi:outer membrane protein insertion porin family